MVIMDDISVKIASLSFRFEQHFTLSEVHIQKIQLHAWILLYLYSNYHGIFTWDK